jgi:anaerobic ribonucleoside-triphosphate reductase activating protein
LGFGGKMIRVAYCAYPIATLGPGLRYGIWLQGCSIRCEGCVSAHLWSHSGGTLKSVKSIIKEVINSNLNRVTISGGEPLDQADELYRFLRSLREARINDIALYTGYDFNEALTIAPWLNDIPSAIIDGRFIKGKKGDRAYCGSSNQRLHILTDDPILAFEYMRYANNKERRLEALISSDGRYNLIVGVPTQSDTQKLLYGSR